MDVVKTRESEGCMSRFRNHFSTEARPTSVVGRRKFAAARAALNADGEVLIVPQALSFR
jgi:hypothetical protein